MKKYIFVCLIALVAMTSCNKSGEAKNDLDRMFLKGSVKSITAREFKAVKTQNGFQKGEPIISTYFWSDNNADYEFDRNGFFLSKRYYYNIFEYKFVDYYEYRRSDNSLEEIEYNKDGKVQKRTITYYNQSGNEISQKEYLADGSISREKQYLYDENNLIVETRTLNPKQEVIGVTMYSYNKDQLSMVVDFVKDSRGDFTGRSTRYLYKKGELIGTKDVSMPYDGKISIEECMFAELEENKDEYEYDKKGNWIKRVFIDKNGEAISIVEREITYY